MALQCDMRDRIDNATFGLPEAAVGSIPGGLGRPSLLLKAVPAAHAMQMVLTGERIDAAEAHRIGLVSETVPAAMLAERALTLAHRVARNAPLAVQAIKKLSRADRAPWRSRRAGADRTLLGRAARHGGPHRRAAGIRREAAAKFHGPLRAAHPIHNDTQETTMTTRFRIFRIARMLLGLACALGATAPASAQPAFPTKPVTLIVPFAPGGGNDILARLIAPQMSKQLGQPVVIENRPGAGGNLGADLVAHAPADGYTLVIASSQITMNPYLGMKVPFQIERDFEPVGLIGSVPLMLVANPDQPYRTLCRVHGLQQGPSRQDQLQQPRARHAAASGRRGLRAHEQDRAAPRAVSRRPGRPSRT